MKDEGDHARNKMKEEIAARLESEKLAKAIERRNQEVFTCMFKFYLTKRIILHKARK